MGNRKHNKMDWDVVTWTVQTASTRDSINGEYRWMRESTGLKIETEALILQQNKIKH